MGRWLSFWTTGIAHEIQRVPRVALKGADPALAQDHVGVAARQQVLRRQQPLLDRRGDAALEQDGLPRAPQLAQQREVLHVPRADLQDVGVARDDLDLADVHHLRHELHAVVIGGRAQHPQAVLAEALEAVGGAAGLERAAAQHLRARPPHGGRGGLDLRLALRRAGPGHDDDLVAPNPQVVDDDHRVLGLERPAGQLVGLGDAHDLLHAVEQLDQPGVGLLGAADRAEHRAEGACGPVHVEPPFDELRDHLLDLVLTRPLFHHYDHGRIPRTPHPLRPAPPDEPRRFPSCLLVDSLL